MMNMKHALLMAGVAVAMCLGTTEVMAQNGGGGGRQGRGNFDPAQMQQRMMERYKEALEVKDDAEWKALEPLIQKVTEARMSSFGGMGRGMFGRRPGGPGGDNAGGDQQAQRPRFGPAPMPEAEALQKAIEAKATNAELKDAIAKLQTARKAKQGELEAAQAKLRLVLTVRQEAIALSMGLL